MTATQPYTAEDMLHLSTEGRYDLIRGVLYSMTPAGGRHGRIAMRIGARLDAFVEERQLGAVFAAETGFLLGRAPDTVLAPDAAFVATERLPLDPDDDGFYAVVPDIAVEVISPSDRTRYVTDKVMAFLEAGARQVWVADPVRKEITVWTPEPAAHVYRLDDTIEGGSVLPGFQIKLADVFS